MRAGRQVILPLWAVSIGLGASADRAHHRHRRRHRLRALLHERPDHGPLRAASGAPSPAWSASASRTSPCRSRTTSTPSVGWFIAVAMLMSLANGVGSGILMTLGADLADKGDPAPFLGAWRFTGDAGSAAAPLLISGVTRARVDLARQRRDGRARSRGAGDPAALRAAVLAARAPLEALAPPPRPPFRPAAASDTRSAAGVVELADTQDLGSCAFEREGSSPFSRTTQY